MYIKKRVHSTVVVLFLLTLCSMVIFVTDVVSKRFFSKPFVSKEDILQVLRIRSEEVGDEKILPEDRHINFFHGPFMETINEMNSEDLSLFVEFCTGYNYLPHDDKFVIEVEFSLHDCDSLPESHTCEQHLVLPRSVYNFDKSLFKKKLFEAMSYTRRLMTMN
jgi:hypothetical protein